MSWIAPTVLAAISAVIIALAWRIRRGATWMLSGYHSERVSDERGLARWAGAGLLRIGVAGVVAAALLALFPAYAFAVIAVYFSGVLFGTVLLARGARRFLVSDERA